MVLQQLRLDLPEIYVFGPNHSDSLRVQLLEHPLQSVLFLILSYLPVLLRLVQHHYFLLLNNEAVILQPVLLLPNVDPVLQALVPGIDISRDWLQV